VGLQWVARLSRKMATQYERPSRPMKSDAEIRQQIAELHAAYGPLVRRRAAALLRGDDLAEDIAQEVFVRMILNISKFRGEASPVTWLYRVTTNLCIDHLRQRARRQDAPLSPGLQQVLSSSEGDGEGRMLHRHELARLLRQLDRKSLQILVHTHLDGMSQEETAQMMGLSRKTVWSKLQRVRKKARAGAI
jgi:RNA polymerase sigma-70 factor (ECF subfamily)